MPENYTVHALMVGSSTRVNTSYSANITINGRAPSFKHTIAAPEDVKVVLGELVQTDNSSTEGITFPRTLDNDDKIISGYDFEIDLAIDEPTSGFDVDVKMSVITLALVVRGDRGPFRDGVPVDTTLTALEPQFRSTCVIAGITHHVVP